jgi:hypothetical protein
MSKRIFIVDDEADTNFALLGALESGFKADSNEYPPIAWRILSHIFNEELIRRIDEIINGTTTIQIRSK